MSGSSYRHPPDGFESVVDQQAREIATCHTLLDLKDERLSANAQQIKSLRWRNRMNFYTCATMVAVAVVRWALFVPKIRIYDIPYLCGVVVTLAFLGVSTHIR